MVVESVDCDTVTVAGGWTKLFRFDMGLRKKREAFAGEQRSFGTLAVIGNHLDVQPHVVRCGRDAAGAIGDDDGLRLAEAPLTRIRAIVLKDRIVLGELFANIERDYR